MIIGLHRSWIVQRLVFVLAAVNFASAMDGDPDQPPARPSTWESAPTPQVLGKPAVTPASNAKRQPSFFKQLGIDFKNIFTTRENLWILGGGLGASLALKPLDDNISNGRFNSEISQGTGLDHVFESGEIVGGALFQIGSAVTTFGLGKLVANPGLENFGRDLVRAQIITQGLTQAGKHAVRRMRPDGSSKKSFPSGHSSGTFATATVIQRHFGWRLGGPAYGIAAYVAASRLSENKHYLSDVVFGAAVGVLVGRTVTFGVGQSRFQISPAAVPAGAGLRLSLAP